MTKPHLKADLLTSRYVSALKIECGNQAYGFAACQNNEKIILKNMVHNDIAIITSYNDMLSTHKPYVALHFNK
ncbi:hypothetical protein [Xenorhabdus vietnamensis]|uniref:hypothetical protein n=1 Tax=Xenorhabdus vietnamensis TaxID=351656 RepID=UPI00111C7C8D|nr:hypothetical protein [Xenorhabdus vietnamensis]